MGLKVPVTMELPSGNGGREKGKCSRPKKLRNGRRRVSGLVRISARGNAKPDGRVFEGFSLGAFRFEAKQTDVQLCEAPEIAIEPNRREGKWALVGNRRDIGWSAI